MMENNMNENNNSVNTDDISAVNLLYKTFSNVGEGVLDLTKSKKQLDLLNDNFEVEVKEEISTDTRDEIKEKNDKVVQSSTQINNIEFIRSNMPIEAKKENIFTRIVNFIKGIFKK